MKKIFISGVISCSLLFGGLIGHQHKAEAASPGETAADIALDFVGVPYKWGGISPSGFDCSGLVNYTYKQAGVSLPRTAAELYSQGQVVSKSSLKEGDLVFFHTYKSGPSHVGIYLNNNRFVHAASSGVRVDSLTSNYWSNAYLGSKRIGNTNDGWVLTNGSWSFYENGVKKTGWVKDNSHWYYLDQNGVMKTNWLFWNGDWYYLSLGGEMVTGWMYSGGNWYFMNADGSMAHDTTVGGYTLDSNGAWVE